MSSRNLRWKRLLLLAALLFGLCQPGLAQYEALELGPEEAAPALPAAGATLFQNVRIFDGKNAALSSPSSVLVRGNIIEQISANPALTGTGADVRVLMPGLIDAHWHMFMAAVSPAVLLTADPGYLNLLAARQAEATLMRGFTTIRDMGGPVFGLKRAIDEGVTVGPRIYPSGAMISQTSGHGDFRSRYEVPRTLGGPLSQSEITGVAAIADSPDEVRLRAREQLRQGASQIKLMAGGGVSSPHNPIESVHLTEAEPPAGGRAARERAAETRAQSDQADGRRRRQFSPQSDRVDPVHRSGASCRGRGGRKLGHLCGRACVYPRCG